MFAEPRDQASLEGYLHQGQWRTAARGGSTTVVLHHVQDFQNNPQGKHYMFILIKDRIAESTDNSRPQAKSCTSTHFLIFETDFHAGCPESYGTVQVLQNKAFLQPGDGD